MVLRLVAQPVRRLLRVWRPSSPASCRFSRVNRHAGLVPVAPEFSGLRLRTPGIPKRAARISIALAYRWHPSGEYRARRVQDRLLNSGLRRRPLLPLPPPILTYAEGNQIVPTRLNPVPATHVQPRTSLPLDLLAPEATQWGARGDDTITPLLSAPDPAYLIDYRPLLPRRYSRFLRASPYPRVGILLLVALTAVVSGLWVARLQGANAAAAHRMWVARTDVEREISAARAYGVSTARLAPLQQRFHDLNARAVPSFLFGGSARRFYLRQEQAYTQLRRVLTTAEHRSLTFWLRHEESTYRALAATVVAARSLGLALVLPAAPACSSPACYRVKVQSQDRLRARLRTQLATLRHERALLAATADPIGSAQSLLQEVRTLASLVTASHLPVALPTLDAREAQGGDVLTLGALAWLDATTLRTRLNAHLPARAVVVSIEDGSLTAYAHGRVVLRSLAFAGPSTPTGVFHIGTRQSALPADYWLHGAGGYQYRSGTLPSWLSFSGDAALQGAPWRSFPSGVVAGYAPSTPRSIDLPPDVAVRLFAWVRLGTEVVVY